MKPFSPNKDKYFNLKFPKSTLHSRMPSSSMITSGDKETTFNSGKYHNQQIKSIKGRTFSSNFNCTPSRWENNDKIILSPKTSIYGSKTRYSQEFIQSKKAIKDIRHSSYDILTTNEKLFGKLNLMNETNSQVIENMKKKIRRVSNEVKEIEDKLYIDSTENMPPVINICPSVSLVPARMEDSRRSSKISSPREEERKFRKTNTRQSNAFEKSKDSNMLIDKLNYYENICPIPKNSKKSITINFDQSNINRGSISKKFSQSDIDKIMEHKKSIKKLEKKIELNEKLSDYINNLDKKNDKRIDIGKIKFKKLSKSYENQIMPYLKYVKLDNIDKYDYIRKIESGDIIKDEICTNFMERILPGNILFKGSGIHNLEILQPRFIKSNFKKKFEIFEGLKPKSIGQIKQSTKKVYKSHKSNDGKN